MSTQAPKSSRPSKSTNQPPFSTPPSSRSSSLSSHLVMVELKQRILTSLSKLSDRDTHQIAVEDLEKIIQSLPPDGILMLLNCLYEACNDPKPAVKKESLRLLAFVCASHGDLTVSHLTKIIGHIVRRLKDSDSGVKDACRDAIGALSAQYLDGDGGDGDNGGFGSMVALFVKPLFEAMSEQNKGVQSGAAMCMATLVDCASHPPVPAFMKLCPRICKLLNNPNFLAKSALLPVVTSLSQVRALAPQSLESLLQSIHECLGSSDWSTRKAAADTLCALALNSSILVAGGAATTLKVLEDCRFDKIKPVRDSMTEALQLWKKISGKGEDGAPDDQKASSCGNNGTETYEQVKLSKTSDSRSPQPGGKEPLGKDSVGGSSPSSSAFSKAKVGSISDKAVVILKKKAPALSDNKLNPEFFQKLETRGSGDLPVEVVVPRRGVNSSNSNTCEGVESNGTDPRGQSNCTENIHNIQRGTAGVYSKREQDDLSRDKSPAVGVNGKDTRTRTFDDERISMNQREEPSGNRAGFLRPDSQHEGSFNNNKGNWLAIQRQLLQLERQQAHLMNMLQDFMGGSHDTMLTLENRVRGLERVVEDMARDLSISSGRRGSSFLTGFEGSSNRSSGKYSGFSEYNPKFGRGSDVRIPFGERFFQPDGIASSMRGRGPPWRSDMSEALDFSTYGSSRNGQIGSRRGLGGGSIDGRSPKSENGSDQIGSRRAWDKGVGPLRLGEGPSARSVWQASKDEATLEAIRVAGEDSGTSRTARLAVPELTAEAMGDDNVVQDRHPIWNSWSNAMDAFEMGDMDSAYAEVVSTGDDLLLVKLMDRSGPVIDQLSNEMANEVLHAIEQFLLEPNLFDICLSWIQQLADTMSENGPAVLVIPFELKKELLLNLHEASASMDPPENWEGATPDQLLTQLAMAWEIDLQHP